MSASRQVTMPTFARRNRFTALARAVKRVLRRPRRGNPRPAEAHISIVYEEEQLSHAAYWLALYTVRNPAGVRDSLSNLWNLGTTALFIQFEEISSPAELVIARCSGDTIAVTGPGLSLKTETHEPAPNGAYLVHRQYRHLGLYENPPGERAIVLLRIVPRSGAVFVVDVPHYVTHFSVIEHSNTIADTLPVPERGELRLAVGPPTEGR
jgi:hypothetical protein